MYILLCSSANIDSISILWCAFYFLVYTKYQSVIGKSLIKYLSKYLSKYYTVYITPKVRPICCCFHSDASALRAASPSVDRWNPQAPAVFVPSRPSLVRARFCHPFCKDERKRHRKGTEKEKKRKRKGKEKEKKGNEEEYLFVVWGYFLNRWVPLRYR